MNNVDYIMGARITSKTLSTKKGAVDPDMCQHPTRALNMKGSNQHELRFHCTDCLANFQRFVLADLHPNPQRPPLGTDRITWGAMFGETYENASRDSHFKQLSLMMAEDRDQTRPWIVRFATFCVMQEGLEATLNPQNPISEMVTQIRTIQENPLNQEWEDLAPDDSISMAGTRMSHASTGRSRTRLN